jgi:TldD protein
MPDTHQAITAIDLHSYSNLFSSYTELRLQENRSQQIALLNGEVFSNTKSSGKGVSARVFEQGVWGFASDPKLTSDAIHNTIEAATRNARFMAKRGGREDATLPVAQASRDSDFATEKPRKSQQELLAFLQTIDDHITQTYTDLTSRSVALQCLDMEKKFHNSEGSSGHSVTTRTLIRVMLSCNNEKAEPIELSHAFGGLGQFEDVFEKPEDLYDEIEQLYQHLCNKKSAVIAQSGYHDVIFDTDLAGILAHEAIGHTTEADLVRAGSVAADFMGQQVAPDNVTLVDFAHTRNGGTLPVPVYLDDEGVESKDAVIIENGILKQFMHNKETAEFFDTAPTGNARAYEFSDEPLVRMRNTAILPGTDKIEDMIASIEDGYYLMRPSNGQADTTSEFMFGVQLGYEIKQGKLGNAITDTTISGVAFDMLKEITMVSDQMTWSCAGMCGKKQIIPVGLGGPAIKTKVYIGGQ